MSYLFEITNLLMLVCLINIHCVRSTVDIRNKGTMLEPDIYGELKLTKTLVGMQRITNSTSFRKLFLLKSTLKWDQSEPIFLEYLEDFYARSTQINPHSVVFSDKLFSLNIEDITFINGSVYDLLRTATNLKNLRLSQMKQVGVSELVGRFGQMFVKLESLTLQEIQFLNGTLYDILRTTTRLKKLEIVTMPTAIGISKLFSKTKPLNFLETLVSLTFRSTILRNVTVSDIFKSFPNLHTLEFQDTGQLAISNLAGDGSKYQSQKMVSLSLGNLKFINGTLYDLLSMTPNLKEIEIYRMGDIDISKLIQERFTHTLISLRFSFGKFIYGNLNDLFEASANLEKLNFRKVDLQYIYFNENIKSLSLWETELGSRSLHELLDTASNLQILELEEMGILDMSKLPHKNLTKLSVVETIVTWSKSFLFKNLTHLDFFDCDNINSTLFKDFIHRFPKVENLDTGTGYVVPPKYLLSMFKSPAMKNLSFAFDFDPQILSYEFGEAVKIMVEAGLVVRPLGDTIPLREKIRYVTFHKYQGAFRVVSSEEYTKLFDVIHRDEKSEETKKFVYIYFLCLGILILFGMFGNSISVYLLLKARMENCAGNILLSLTVFDSAVILTYLASSFFNARIFYNMFVQDGEKLGRYVVEGKVWVSEQSDVQAFLIYPLNKTAYTASVYTTVLIALERFVAVCYPLKTKLILTPSNSKLGILGVFLFSIFLNLPRWVESYEWNMYSETSQSWNDYYRPTFMRMKNYKLIYHGCVWVSFMYVLPFVLIGFLNFKIFQQTKKSSLMRKLFGSSRTSTEEVIDLRSTTKILLCVVGVFVLCNACHIAIIFYYLLIHKQIELSTIEAVACVPIVINCSVNFIIYIMLGRTMRSKFIELLPRWLSSCFTRGTLPANANIELTQTTIQGIS